MELTQEERARLNDSKNTDSIRRRDASARRSLRKVPDYEEEIQDCLEDADTSLRGAPFGSPVKRKSGREAITRRILKGR